MLEYINSAACIALMLYSLSVAMVMPARKMWTERVSLAIVQVGLFFQVVSPWVDWLPQVTWVTALLHISTAVMIGCYWRRLWLFVRTQFGDYDPPIHPIRRVSDFAPLSEREFRHVQGGRHD